jgi:hypothetical protein
MRFDDYLFRSHSVGHIINVPTPLTPNQLETLNAYNDRYNGNGRPLTQKQQEDRISLLHKQIESGKYSISDATKKLLSQLVFAKKYKRTTVLNANQIKKGLSEEKEARDILTRVSGLFLTASEERKSNKWVTGKIDIEPDEVIIDIKSSYSWESFSNILQEKPNQIYLHQGDSYMDLWEKKHFLLCHVLTDTPINILQSEIRKADYHQDFMSIDGNVRDEKISDVKQIISNHIFSRKGIENFCNFSPFAEIEWFDDFIEIPEKDRVHMISHDYDPVRIEQRNECIKICREFMNTVTPINNSDLL